MRRYTRHELDSMEIPALKAICREAKIRPESMSVYNDKAALIRLIYKYCGTVSDPNISQWDAEKISRLKKAVEEKGSQQNDIRVEIPAYLEVYKGMDSSGDNGGRYTIRSAAALGMTSALLVDRLGDVQSILDVLPGMVKHTYLINFRGHLQNNRLHTGLYSNFSLIFFPSGFERISRVYNSKDGAYPGFAYIKTPVHEIMVREIEETDDVLVIDYGTSYTTAGAYTGGKIELTRFLSEEPCECAPDIQTRFADCQNCGRCALCPSIVAVKSCEGGRVEFTHGHEAKESARLARNSVFFDTKRWVISFTDTVTVKDADGNTALVKRSEIIGSFLKYIILAAERQHKKRYKNICFTSPVKQRALSLKMYSEVLREYNVVSDGAINEAVAVVYASLAEQVENLDYTDGEENRVLLIDCGGSTSDMVQCDYTIRHQGKYSDINLAVGYASGDTNFGGNNLTCRIMQYLKIKLACYYQKEREPGIGSLLEVSNFDIYDFVDAHGSEMLYRRFEDAYHEAGEIIPTDFSDYVNDAQSVYLNVKGNFYFLWDLAERVKVGLYEDGGVYEFSFDRLKSAGNIYMLCTKNAAGVFATHMEWPPLRVSINEITLLLKPEIYGLLKKFIEPYYDADKTMSDITGIKLSGQSTKIEIFRDVVKEYVAGHKVRVPFERSYRKKLKCIIGAIAYQNAKAMGRIRPTISYNSARVPYCLTVEAFNRQKEAVLITQGCLLSEIYGYIDRTIETQTVIFTLNGYDMEALREIEIDLHSDGYSQTDYDHLCDSYKWMPQGDIDRIDEDEVRLFVYSDDDSWGFKLLSVARRGDTLLVGDEQFIPFESADWETNFFDGKR